MSKTAEESESEGSVPKTVDFARSGIRDGFLTCVPVALGVGGYGVVFGVVAREAGLSVGEAALMSATVLAGAAQLIAVELWKTDASAVAVLVTTLVVNLRYVLMEQPCSRGSSGSPGSRPTGASSSPPTRTGR